MITYIHTPEPLSLRRVAPNPKIGIHILFEGLDRQISIGTIGLCPTLISSGTYRGVKSVIYTSHQLAPLLNQEVEELK